MMPRAVTPPDALKLFDGEYLENCTIYRARAETIVPPILASTNLESQESINGQLRRPPDLSDDPPADWPWVGVILVIAIPLVLIFMAAMPEGPR